MSTPEETVVVLVSGLQILATAVDAVQERLDALDGPHDTVGLLDLQSEIHELTTKVSKLAKTTKKVAKKK